MRWLPRRRRGEHRDAPPQSPGPADERARAGQTGPERSSAERTTARQTAAGPVGAAHWRRLPPLAPTIRRAPLTAAATLGVLADERVRPLIHPVGSGRVPSRRRRDESEPVEAVLSDESAAVQPLAGRVTGLATVRAEAPAEPEEFPEPAPSSPRPARRRAPVAEPVQVPDEPPPSAPRLLPRVLPSAGPRPVLVRAEDEYVGAPEPDEAPYASSAWLRMVQSYRPPWADDQAAAAAGGMPTPQMLPPIPEGGASWSSEAPAPPPRPAPAARPGGAGPQRRASLAESRRLGLGHPLRPSAERESGPRESQESQDSGSSSPEPSASRSQVSQVSETVEATEDSPDAPPARPVTAAEMRHVQPERTESPASVSPPETDVAADARTEADIAIETDTEAEPNPRPRPRPRLGLGAPIDRPVRPPRDRSQSAPPAPRLARPAPTRPDTAPAPTPPSTPAAVPTPPHAATPSPQAADAADEASGRPAGGPAEPARPTPRRRAEPVYRFVPAPAERPDRAAASPRPATGTDAPSPATSSPPPPRPAASPSTPPTPPAAAAVPLTAPAVRSSALATAPIRSLTYPRAQRRADAGRFETELAPTAPVSVQTAAPALSPALSVPSELLDAVRWTQGVDVSDVPIRREPEVAEEARALGALSFTRGGEVFLPSEQGSPQEPVARGLLAHELIHAAQQRSLGSALPSEDSDAGRALEAQAVAAERWARGLSSGLSSSASGSFAGHGGAPTAPPAASWSAPWPNAGQAAPTNGVQRQTEDVAGMPETAFMSAPSAGNAQAPDASGQAAAATAPPAGTYGDDGLGSAKDQLLKLSQKRPLDLDDPGDIEELSVRIYQKIHRRLRRELLVERERAGRLGEAGPFGPAR